MKEKKSVLIVEDEPMLLVFLKKSLMAEGYACDSAVDGKAALELLEHNEYDLLLTDVVLPELDGFSLIQEASRLYPSILIIMMTGFIDDFSYEGAINAGASDFIKKPFTVEELLVRIRQVENQVKFKVMSITDDLTGLLNRRGFFPVAEQQLKLANRYKKKASLLYADQDNLKWINDTWGHKEGDRAVQSIATIMKDTFRNSDIIARMGGDEFAVLMMTGPDREDMAYLERLKENLIRHNEKHADRYVLSVSIGCVSYDPEDPCSLDELLTRADTSMYQDKHRKKTLH